MNGRAQPAGLELGPAGDTPVAHISGDVDASNAAELRRALEAAAAPDAIGLVLDISEVTFLDSSGIHLLQEVTRRLTRRGQGLRVVPPRGAGAAQVLRLVAAEQFVIFADTVDQGVGQLSRPAPRFGAA